MKFRPQHYIDDSVDLICLSHLRWDFVYQRPQHLLSRAAKTRRTFFFEEPIFDDIEKAHYTCAVSKDGPYVVTPHIPAGTPESTAVKILANIMNALILDYGINRYVFWYYTPMAFKFTRHLSPIFTVYDCMDQLSHFKFAPKEISILEAELFARVDIVFTGGQSLYESKKFFHKNVYVFPSSIDIGHFAQARKALKQPPDQCGIYGPRIGYIGVIDERIDLDLIAGIAVMRPQWSIVMIGPVVKIDYEMLPRHSNIYYLGNKSYEKLPDYLSGWDAAILPFARNAATQYISPTKTPEYLAAGRKVVSTSIRDVVRPYGDSNLIAISDTAEGFVNAVEQAFNEKDGYPQWLQRVDHLLSGNSWDKTYQKMWALIQHAYNLKVVSPALGIKNAKKLHRVAAMASLYLERSRDPLVSDVVRS